MQWITLHILLYCMSRWRKRCYISDLWNSTLNCLSSSLSFEASQPFYLEHGTHIFVRSKQRGKDIIWPFFFFWHPHRLLILLQTSTYLMWPIYVSSAKAERVWNEIADTLHCMKASSVSCYATHLKHLPKNNGWIQIYWPCLELAKWWKDLRI